MIINHKYGFLFVHIQKTAGSSISKNLLKCPGSDYLGKTHSFIRDYPVSDDIFKFTFVRNPWERLVSWYNMLVKNTSMTNDFKEYILGNSSNFSEFLNCTQEITEGRSGFKEDDVIYRKSIAYNQIDYISDKEGRIAVDFIGRFENLQADFETIKKRFGLRSSKLKRINAFSHNHYRSFYSDEDAHKVSRLYKRDIDFFNYSF